MISWSRIGPAPLVRHAFSAWSQTSPRFLSHKNACRHLRLAILVFRTKSEDSHSKSFATFSFQPTQRPWLSVLLEWVLPTAQFNHASSKGSPIPSIPHIPPSVTFPSVSLSVFSSICLWLNCSAAVHRKGVETLAFVDLCSEELLKSRLPGSFLLITVWPAHEPLPHCLLSSLLKRQNLRPSPTWPNPNMHFNRLSQMNSISLKFERPWPSGGV